MTRRILTAVVSVGLFVAAPLTALAQPDVGAEAEYGAIRGPASAAYGARFTTSAPQGSIVRWSISPAPDGMFLLSHPNLREFVVAGPPGVYTIRVEIVVQRVGELTKPLNEYKKGDPWPVTEETTAQAKTFTLTGGTPGPGPGPGPPPIPPGPGPAPPGPGPTPPGPVDPAVTAFKAAAAQSGWGPAQLNALAVACTNAAAKTATGMTVAQIMKAHATEFGAAFPSGIPDPVRNLLGERLNQLNSPLPPAQPGKVPTMDQVAVIKSVLTLAADVLKEAAK